MEIIVKWFHLVGMAYLVRVKMIITEMSVPKIEHSMPKKSKRGNKQVDAAKTPSPKAR